MSMHMKPVDSKVKSAANFVGWGLILIGGPIGAGTPGMPYLLVVAVVCIAIGWGA